MKRTTRTQRTACRAAQLSVPVCALFWLAACGGTTPAPAPVATAPTPAEAAPPASWNGQWNGPEGTYLRIEGGAGTYSITIANLDGPRTFAGKAAGTLIEFERDGVQETIRPTDGAGTGMKWLADKSVCLTVRVGEGYCRS